MKRPFLLLPPALFLSIVAGCGGGAAAGADSNAEYTACLQAQTKALVDAAASKETRGIAKGPFSAALLTTDGAKLASIVRDDLKSNMRASLDNARASRIAAVRCEYLRPEPGSSSGGFQDAGAAMPSSAAGNDGSGGAKQVSGTNNQVAGVDEADFVKNDNKYIYVANGSSFRVIDAWPAESAHEIRERDGPRRGEEALRRRQPRPRLLGDAAPGRQPG